MCGYANVQMKKSVLYIFLAFVSTTSYCQKVNKAKLDSFLNSLDANNKLMGSVSVAKRGVIQYIKAIGYVSVEKKTKANVNTKYRIGSISKMFTAVMIMQLIEEKKLALNTRLSEFFPKIQNADSITIERMLCHRSGIHNFTSDDEYVTWMIKPIPREKMLELLYKQDSDFEPGLKGRYSNTNFLLLGYIIEKITGNKYDVELLTRITSKINLKNTYYGSKINISNNEALSYDSLPWKLQPETDMSIPGGAGGIVSTPSDLTLFINALFTEKLVSATSLKTMMTLRDKYGLGIIKAPYRERETYGHNGNIDGFSSTLFYFPDDSVSFGICSNGENYFLNQTLVNVLDIYYNKEFKLPPFKTIKLDSAHMEKYEGIYVSGGLAPTLRIMIEDDHLVGQGTDQDSFVLDVYSETNMRNDKDGVAFVFTLPTEGSVQRIKLIESGKEYTYKRAKD